jgi:hypothetical protein
VTRLLLTALAIAGLALNLIALVYTVMMIIAVLAGTTGAM